MRKQELELREQELELRELELELRELRRVDSRCSQRPRRCLPPRTPLVTK